MTDTSIKEQCKTDVKIADRFKKQLPEITEAIIASCYDPACFTHIDYEPIPSRENVIRIINRFMELLFPGYFSRKKVDPTNLTYSIGDAVITLYNQLSEQISLGIRHDCFRYDIPCSDCEKRGHDAAIRLFGSIPDIKKMLADDVRATFEGDPAARGHDEIIFSYPGIFAISVYRIAHTLFKLKIPLLPRIMTEYAHSETGIDIHPGATIGKRFAIDHGTGVVIGETTVIGDNVRIYQGVTLGALSLPPDCGERYKGVKRHPTIEDNAIIYSGATILGGDTVIGKNAVIGGNVWLTESVPANTKVFLEQPKLIYK
ncbi:MAG: serine acetyltransferase [Proteobacteria bacterium]|nr:serine acetyltransferase [Pseudomonadota bacterium]